MMRGARHSGAVAMAVLILAGQATAGGPRRRAARPVVDRQDFVAHLLAVRAVDLQFLDAAGWPAGSGGSLEVELDHQPCTLTLEPHAVRAPGYRLLVETDDGTLVNVVPGPAETYRGTAVEWPGSHVAASRRADGWHVRIRLPSGAQYWIQPTARQAPGGAAGEHAVYRAEDVMAEAGACDDDPPVRPADAVTRGAAGLTPCDGELCVAQLACDGDSAFVATWGILGAEARIHDVINLMNTQFEQDLGVTHQISAVVLRNAATDPYSTSVGSALLAQAHAYWNEHHADIAADAVQLFTGRDLEGSTIGTAYIGALCSNASFSVVQSDCCGSLGCAADLSAHELAHLWSATHCNCADYTMNPVIFCAQRFHAMMTLPALAAARDAATCLHALSACGSDSACDDGLMCNGVEICSNGQCITGELPDCDDGIACTLDLCDEATGACTHVGQHGACDNGLFCDGIEKCDEGFGCTVGAGPCGAGWCDDALDQCVDCLGAAHCDDGIDCTTDTCQAGVCHHDDADLPCDNGVFCDGAERCDGQGGCSAGMPPCDGMPCNEAAGQCVACLDHPDCDDGVFCNGAEACFGGACMVGAVPCPGLICMEQQHTCADTCGDGQCGPGEDCQNCIADCTPASAALCGNGVCDVAAGEDCMTCSGDCRGIQYGTVQRRFCCGAGGGENPIDCGDARCSVRDWECAAGQPAAPCCGDGLCTAGEDGCMCAADCGSPAAGEFDCFNGLDDDCNGAVDCADPACAAACILPCLFFEFETGSRCSDGIDNDCDGAVDAADSDCP